MVTKRNQEFHELSRRLAFGRDLEEAEILDDDDDRGEPPIPVTFSIYETEGLFWMVRSIIQGQG